MSHYKILDTEESMELCYQIKSMFIGYLYCCYPYPDGKSLIDKLEWLRLVEYQLRLRLSKVDSHITGFYTRDGDFLKKTVHHTIPMYTRMLSKLFDEQ